MSQYAYNPYLNTNLGHHYKYVMPSLSKILPPPEKLIKILDLGCGNGSFTNYLTQQGFNATGLDPSESGIALAKQSFPDIEFIQGDIYNLPFSQLENQFDYIVSIDVIEHLYLPRIMPQVAKRCLKAEGKLIITTPYHGYLKNIALSVSGKFDHHVNPLWDGGHIKFFSVKTLTQLLQTEGFQTIDFYFAGRLRWLWKDMICVASKTKRI
jgi:2-polyprenyl-3-methyl-5-hydroxy-6-metoxy-1,4-benzoquinol methylase